MIYHHLSFFLGGDAEEVSPKIQSKESEKEANYQLAAYVKKREFPNNGG